MSGSNPPETVVHVLSPLGGGEFAVCGMAYDAYASGDAETDDTFAKARPGLHVTCPHCIDAINKLTQTFRGLHLGTG